jgi:type I restriction enzyme S subunit
MLTPEPQVLSCSKDYGLVPQTALFSRRLASADTSRYKIVEPGQFVYDPNLLWSGAIARSELDTIGIVSPVYEVFSVREGINPEFMQQWLLLPERIRQYVAISDGTNVRRRRAGFEHLGQLEIYLPPIQEQLAIADILRSVDLAIETTETVIKQTELRARACCRSC